MFFKYKDKNYELILLTLSGSMLYGNNTAESDIDLRGVIIQDNKDKFSIGNNFTELPITKEPLGHKLEPKELISKIKNDSLELSQIFKGLGLDIPLSDDVVLYELEKFIIMSSTNNPNIMDILNTDDKATLYVSNKGKKLLDNKNLFLTKRMKETFTGYADQQLKKIKRHNKHLIEYPLINEMYNILLELYEKKEIDFTWLANNTCGKIAEKITKESSQSNTKLDNSLSKQDFISRYPKYKIYLKDGLLDHTTLYDLKHHKIPLDDLININGGLITYSDFLHNNASFRHFSPSMNSIFTNGKGIINKNNLLRENEPKIIGEFVCLMSVNFNQLKASRDKINKLWNWKAGRNESRNKMEEEFGVDLKHLSHLWRLMFKCNELFKINIYNPRLHGESLEKLKGIRTGSLWGKNSFKKSMEEFEILKEELQIAYDNSSLPNNINKEIINELYLKLRKDYFLN